MGSTRALPFTEFPPRDAVFSGPMQKLRIAIRPFDVSSAEITGGHHEGLLQVRQPWIWGLSEEQKAVLYRDAADIARYAFIDELLGLDQKVFVVAGAPPVGRIDYLIIGAVQSVELNTYGRGTLEGFGSAGNYWEAEVVLSLSIERLSDKKAIWAGEIAKYCKLEGSPAQLNWTIFTVVAKSLQEGLALSKGVTPGSMQEVVETSAADYQLAPVERNPVEIATRLAARELLQLLFSQR